MMKQVFMNTESMVALTVVGSLVFSAIVLTVRTLLSQRIPARQPVKVQSRRQA